MKYRLICFLIFASLLVACEKDPIDTKGNAISFNNSPARAAVVPNEQNGLVDNARVWGYYVNGSNTTWVWGNATAGEKANLEIGTDENNNLTGGLVINGNTKYWFDGTYDFFSIYSEKCINGVLEPTFSGGTLSFDYSIEDQKELRYACHLNTAGRTDRTDKVDFNYQHLLSRVKFQGFSTDSESPITVTSVSVANVPSKATISMNIGDIQETDKKSLTAAYTLSTTDKFTISNSSTDGITCNNTAGNIVLDKMVFPSDEALKALTFSVTYNTSSENGKTKTATLTGYNFEAGKSYILKFKIQPSGPIIFGNTIVVEPWDKNDTSNDQNLDFDTTKQ